MEIVWLILLNPLSLLILMGIAYFALRRAGPAARWGTQAVLALLLLLSIAYFSVTFLLSPALDREYSRDAVDAEEPGAGAEPEEDGRP